MQNIEPQGEFVLGAIANGEAPQSTTCIEAYIVSIAVSLKRIADRLERVTILPGEDSDSRGQLNVGADVRNHY